MNAFELSGTITADISDFEQKIGAVDEMLGLTLARFNATAQAAEDLSARFQSSGESAAHLAAGIAAIADSHTFSASSPEQGIPGSSILDAVLHSTDEVKQRFAELSDLAPETTLLLQEFVARAPRNFTRMFDAAIKTGFTDGWGAAFKSVLEGFAQMLEQMAMKMIESQVYQWLAKLSGVDTSGDDGGSAGGGSGIGGIIGTLGSFFQGFFADGGSFSGGQAMVVGEHGPELLVPRGSGTVIPAGKFGGGGHTFNFNFYGAQNPDAFRRSMPLMMAEAAQQAERHRQRLT